MDSVELSTYRSLYLCALILALTPVFFGARWLWRQRFSPLKRRLRGAIVFAPLISLCAFPLFHLNFGWRVCYEIFEWVTDEDYIKMALAQKSGRPVEVLEWGEIERSHYSRGRIKSIFATANNTYLHEPEMYQNLSKERIGAFPERFSSLGEIAGAIGKRSRKTGRRFYDASPSYRDAVSSRVGDGF